MAIGNAQGQQHTLSILIYLVIGLRFCLTVEIGSADQDLGRLWDCVKAQSDHMIFEVWHISRLMVVIGWELHQCAILLYKVTLVVLCLKPLIFFLNYIGEGVLNIQLN